MKNFFLLCIALVYLLLVACQRFPAYDQLPFHDAQHTICQLIEEEQKKLEHQPRNAKSQKKRNRLMHDSAVYGCDK